MRMAELSRRSEIPVATIKYYVREGLLPPGETTAPNQADYGPEHLERLGLIRALREAGGLSVSTIGRVFAAMDDYEAGSRPEFLTTAVAELSDPLVVPPEKVDEFARARDRVADLLTELGWRIDAASPGRDDLVRALVAIDEHLPAIAPDVRDLVDYAQAVRRLADLEIPDDYDPGADPAGILRFSVLGTVLFEPLILALRKLAHVDRIRSTPSATWAT